MRLAGPLIKALSWGVVDWSQVDKAITLAMERSPIEIQEIKHVLKQAPRQRHS